jgi:ribosomal protein S28E/S33
MPDRKVIAVLGATGAHGGALVRAILNDPNGSFTARVLTRDVNGAKRRISEDGVRKLWRQTSTTPRA